MQLQRQPSVLTVAQLVKEVRGGGRRCRARPLSRAAPHALLHHLLARLQMNYNNKHLVGAMIVAGWDSVEGGQVYGCPIGGTMSREKWTVDGSGSTYIWGFLDSEYRCGGVWGEGGGECEGKGGGGGGAGSAAEGVRPRVQQRAAGREARSCTGTQGQHDAGGGRKVCGHCAAAGNGA